MTCVCAQMMYSFEEIVSFIFTASPEGSTVPGQTVAQ